MNGTHTDAKPEKSLTTEKLLKAKKIIERYSQDDTPYIEQPQNSILPRCKDKPSGFVNTDAINADLEVNRLTALEPPTIRCHPTDHDYCLAMVRSWEVEEIPFRIETRSTIPEGRAWLDIPPDEAIILDLASGEGYHFKKPKFKVEGGKIHAYF